MPMHRFFRDVRLSAASILHQANAAGSRMSISIVLIAAVAAAQQPQQPAPDDRRLVKFSSSSQLVVETVTVNDKSGKPIEGLTSKDFTITEDGVPQKIQRF